MINEQKETINNPNRLPGIYIVAVMTFLFFIAGFSMKNYCQNPDTRGVCSTLVIDGINQISDSPEQSQAIILALDMLEEDPESLGNLTYVAGFVQDADPEGLKAYWETTRRNATFTQASEQALEKVQSLDTDHTTNEVPIELKQQFSNQIESFQADYASITGTSLSADKAYFLWDTVSDINNNELALAKSDIELIVTYDLDENDLFYILMIHRVLSEESEKLSTFSETVEFINKFYDSAGLTDELSFNTSLIILSQVAMSLPYNYSHLDNPEIAFLTDYIDLQISFINQFSDEFNSTEDAMFFITSVLTGGDSALKANLKLASKNAVLILEKHKDLFKNLDIDDLRPEIKFWFFKFFTISLTEFGINTNNIEEIKALYDQENIFIEISSTAIALQLDPNSISHEIVPDPGSHGELSEFYLVYNTGNGPANLIFQRDKNGEMKTVHVRADNSWQECAHDPENDTFFGCQQKRYILLFSNDGQVNLVPTFSLGNSSEEIKAFLNDNELINTALIPSNILYVHPDYDIALNNQETIEMRQQLLVVASNYFVITTSGEIYIIHLDENSSQDLDKFVKELENKLGELRVVYSIDWGPPNRFVTPAGGQYSVDSSQGLRRPGVAQSLQPAIVGEIISPRR